MSKAVRPQSNRPSTKRVRKLASDLAQCNSEPEQPHQLSADLARLRSLLEQAYVEEARKFVKELQTRWPKAEQVGHYARVLAPPVTRRRDDLPRRPLDQEQAWLREHAHDYPGCWLAVVEDQLIAAGPDFAAVLTQAREKVGVGRAFLHFQPRPLEPC